MWNAIRYAGILTVAALIALTACSSDGGSDGAAGSGAAAGSGGSQLGGPNITGKVSYAGTQKGKLVVAAFKTWPSNNAPETFTTITSPTYPQAYELEDLDPGEYYVFAFVDVDPPSPTLPGSEDVRSVPTTPVQVVEGKCAQMDVTIPAN